MAPGVPEDQAKLDICRAIANRKIPIRLTVIIEPDASMKWHRMSENAMGLGPHAVWKRVPDALARLVAGTGIDEAQAKQSTCRAIADHRLKIRVRDIVGTVRSGAEFEIPSDLKPSDFDWQHSRPLKPWLSAQQGDNTQVHIESIEVLIEGSDQSIECFEGADVKAPPHLQPSDFDWENSRPRKPWPVKLRGARLGEWRSFSHPALLIELHIAEVLAWIRETYSSTADGTNGKPKQLTATAAEEDKATQALALYLRRNPDLKRSEAAK
jgi:hypothetical protein